MDILVFGAGATGSLIGGLLSVRHDVTLVGRGDHMEAIRSRGLRITGKTARVVHPETATRIPPGAHPQLIVVSTKAYDTAAAMFPLKRFAASAVFLTLQNGLDNPEIIGRTAKRVIAGTTSHGVTVLGLGEIRHAGIGDTVVGGWQGVEPEDVVRVRDVLEEAGFRTRISKDIRVDLWAKLVVNAAINPLAALAGVPNGRLVRDRDLSRLLDEVGREALAVAAAEGVPLDREDTLRRTRLVARRTASNRASMLKDLYHCRRTEIDAITGAILRTAERHGLEAPRNRTLYALIRARETAAAESA
ncbi:MAG TPA: 2-dehydropantoate 2-reductase [Thermoplasmata archaeon]|nr:2-dehydropantoate 2-reductase [Thermoplasmata archaeon]